MTIQNQRHVTMPLDVGGVYVNYGEYTARVIMRVGTRVLYCSISYPDIRMYDIGQCQRGTFRAWASRKLQQEEVNGMVTTPQTIIQIADEQREEEHLSKLRNSLGKATDEEIEEELSFRRLTNSKKDIKVHERKQRKVKIRSNDAEDTDLRPDEEV